MSEPEQRLEAYILVPRDSAVRVAYRLNDWVAEQGIGTCDRWYKVAASPLQGYLYVIVDGSYIEHLIGTATCEPIQEFGQWAV